MSDYHHSAIISSLFLAVNTYEDAVFEFNPNVLKILGYPSAQLAARKKKLIEEGKKVYDFGTGDPIEPTAQFIRAAVGEGTPVVSQYPNLRGSVELRKSIAGYLHRRFNVACDQDKEIIQCTGSKESIYNLVFLMVGPESKIGRAHVWTPVTF